MKQIHIFPLVFLLLGVMILCTVHSVNSEQQWCGNRKCGADEACISKFGRYRAEGCQKLGKEDAKCDHLRQIEGKYIQYPPCQPGLLCRVRSLSTGGPKLKRCTDPNKPTVFRGFKGKAKQ